jgi:6-phosphogluconolactonase
LVKILFAILLVARILAAQGVYIGGYGKGIYFAEFNSDTGALTAPVLAVDAAQPSFLALHPNRRFLYAVNEVDEGRVSGFAIASPGKLASINSTSSKGPGPCHLSIDAASGSVFVANYNGGSIAVLPIDQDGRLGEATAFVQHKGAKPHAHWIGLAPGGKLLMVADLGLDKVLLYDFNPRRRSLKPSFEPFLMVAPDSGPRHIAIHPSGRYFYVINELASTITAFSLQPLGGIESVRTLPDGYSGENSTAEIAVHPSGRFLYGSNRGHDSIAVFSVNQSKGTLTPVEDVPTRGKTPRNFEIDPTGRWLLAANQNSNSIAVFRIDTATGRLTPSSLIEGVPSPACIKFAY